MKVLIIGSGGREHALAWKISKSNQVSKIYCAPGNGGTASFCENLPIKDNDIEGLLAFAYENKIDLTVVGPEVPLTEGIVDTFIAHGLRVFGPCKEAAELEGSKAFAKDVMDRFHIPTAEFKIFESADKAKAYVEGLPHGVVIKADGLAAGKGVYVCATKEEALEALEKIMVEKQYGTAGDVVVVEELLIGQEVSVLAFTDGKTVVPMVSCQDHKQLLDGDKGPNTGGMGIISPVPFYTKELAQTVMEQVLIPTVKGMEEIGRPFKGILYAGLMITEKGPKVLEFNARFGDPETEVLMMSLKTDLVDIMNHIIDGTLEEIDVVFEPSYVANVVLASGGYPESYEKGFVIEGLDTLPGEIAVFHAGTELKGDAIVTSGGRVLNVVAKGETLEGALNTIYTHIPKLSFHNMYYRKDIGKRVL